LGNVTTRMIIEESNQNVGGFGRPLLIFPSDYVQPAISIHEAAVQGMRDNWDNRLKYIFCSTVSQQLSQTQAVIDISTSSHLTEDEAGAIIYYTADARSFGGKINQSLYLVLNYQLALRDIDDLWKPFLFYLIKALQKLPDYQGTVYRGLDKPLTQLSPQYKKK